MLSGISVLKNCMIFATFTPDKMRNNMNKKTILFCGALLLAAVMAGCKGKKNIEWSVMELPVSAFAMPDDEIEVSYPVASGTKSADEINRQITRTLTSFWDNPGLTVPEAVDSLLAERNAEELIRHIPYSITTNSEVYTYGKVASVILYPYVYLGGAHGIGATLSLKFDTETGDLIDLTELFADTAALSRVNRDVFAQVHRSDPAYFDGLFIPLEQLPLPENTALDSAGLHVFYNVYEIAPYVFGPTEYMIPMQEIESLLQQKTIGKK